jgi:hypothetical protein
VCVWRVEGGGWMVPAVGKFHPAFDRPSTIIAQSRQPLRFQNNLCILSRLLPSDAPCPSPHTHPLLLPARPTPPHRWTSYRIGAAGANKSSSIGSFLIIASSKSLRLTGVNKINTSTWIIYCRFNGNVDDALAILELSIIVGGSLLRIIRFNAARGRLWEEVIGAFYQRLVY